MITSTQLGKKPYHLITARPSGRKDRNTDIKYIIEWNWKQMNYRDYVQIVIGERGKIRVFRVDFSHEVHVLRSMDARWRLEESYTSRQFTKKYLAYLI